MTPGRAARIALLLIQLMLAAVALAAWRYRQPDRIPHLAGIVWQLDNQTLEPRGNWQRIGAGELLVQWTSIDGSAYVAHPQLPLATVLPAWQRIAEEPWAREVILGLAGRFDENSARADIAALAQQSALLAALPLPLNIVAWYFPVEIDPTWAQAAALAPLLNGLPRPLWISVYDSANVGAVPLADSLLRWLPADVGIFFQDGVGVHAREAMTARQYLDVLSSRFGRDRVRVIAEAFRPKIGGGFRSATVDELRLQLSQYQGYRIYLFDGPHYLPDALVDAIALAQQPERGWLSTPAY